MDQKSCKLEICKEFDQTNKKKKSIDSSYILLNNQKYVILKSYI